MKELIITGPPGTGKTSEIKKVVTAMLKSGKVKNYEIGLTSFTKTGAIELTGGTAVPASCIGTLHSFAFRGLGLDKEHVAEDLIKVWNEENPAYQLSAKGIKPNFDEAGPVENKAATDADLLFSYYNIARARLSKPELLPPNVKRFADRWEAWKKLHEFYDFSDMIKLATESVDIMPVHYSDGTKKWSGPKVLFGDEYQDFTRAEARLFKKWSKSTDMTLMVGDLDQQLYYFKGATPDTMIRPDLPDMQKRVLKHSFRVPKAVHSAALKLIKRIKAREDVEYYPTEVEGSIGPVAATYEQPWLLMKELELDLKQNYSIGIMAPCGFQLDKIISMLRIEGLPYCNTYRPAKWNPLTPSGVSSANRLLTYMRPYWSNEDLKKWAGLLDSRTALLHGQKKKIEALEGPDKVPFSFLREVFRPDALAELLGVTTDDLPGLEALPVEHLPEFIKTDVEVFYSYLTGTKQDDFHYPFTIAKKRGVKALEGPYKIQIGTIHSFKGGQFDSIYIIPDLSTKGLLSAQKSREEYDATVRMFYVALTRAKLKASVLSAATAGGFRLL